MIPSFAPLVRALADGRAEVSLQAVLPLHVALEIAALAALHGRRPPLGDAAANDDDRPKSGPRRRAR
jgi:hypothetical protein